MYAADDALRWTSLECPFVSETTPAYPHDQAMATTRNEDGPIERVEATADPTP
jgi:hypothetical protein